MIVFCLSLCSISVAPFTNTQTSSLPINAINAVLFCDPTGRLLGTCGLAPIEAFVVFLFQLRYKESNSVFIFILKEEGVYAHQLQHA